jgi:uncharacterized phage-like protein YoqJ
MKIAITGHRPNKLGNDYDLTSPLILQIKQAISKILGELHLKYSGDITLITGMALGIDTLFAKMAIENDTPFIAAIPCYGQAAVWPKRSQDIWRDLLNKASEIINVSGQIGYKSEYMQQRNIWMVDNCDLLIAVWDGTPGGTANCVKYAISKNKPWIHINPKTMEVKYSIILLV